MSCECKLAGWCERHQVKKTERMRELCIQDLDYWEAWEEGRGPGQNRKQEKPLARKPVEPLPYAKWPMWAKAIAAAKTDEDTGVGDTFERVASWMGGTEFKRWSQAAGVPCKCGARKEDWNKRYPYL